MEKEYFVGYLADKKVNDYYNRICSDLHEKFGIKNLSQEIPPHFTLKPPFLVDSIQDLEQFIEMIIPKVEKSIFEICDFKSLEGKRMTIVLSPMGEYFFSEMKKTAEILNSYNISNDRFIENLKPHLTIGRFISQEQFPKIWEYVQCLEKPHFDSIFDNLTIFVKNKDQEKWEIYKTYQLL